MEKELQPTKIFFDTEFTGLHQKTMLISIGLVSDCGKKFYAEFNDYDPLLLDDWLKHNVIANLRYQYPYHSKAYKIEGTENEVSMIGNTEQIKAKLEQWISQFKKVEMYSDCLAYDWVLFCNIWGHAFNIPKNIYYIPFDICTMFKLNRIDPDINREDFAYGKMRSVKSVKKHNALWDAIVIRDCYYELKRRINTSPALTVMENERPPVLD